MWKAGEQAWQASSGRHLSTLSGHWRSDEKNLGIVSLASHPQRTLLATCAVDGTVCFWSPPVRQNWLIKMQNYVELIENEEEHIDQSQRDCCVNEVHGLACKENAHRADGEDADVHVFLQSAKEQEFFISATPWGE